MKVAIPVDDPQETIQVRTGRALYFAVYSIQEDTFKRERLEDNPHGQKHHHDHQGEDEESHESHRHGSGKHRLNNHIESLKSIKDCDYLLAIAVGPYMKEALKQLGIQHIKFKKKDGTRAEDFVRTFLSSNLSTEN